MTGLCTDGREIPVYLAITRIPQDAPGPSPATFAISPNANEAKTPGMWLMRKSCAARSAGGLFLRTPPWVALTDLNGRFIATNPVFQKMLGYTGKELQSLTFFDIRHEQALDHSGMLIAELLAGERQQFQIEKQYRRKDGTSVWVRNNASIVPGTERAPRFLMALSEDITQRKLSEEALAKARSELTNVARVTSLGLLTASIARSQPTIFGFDE